MLKALILSLALANAADVASTEWALKKPGVVEANPIMRGGGGGRVGLKAGATVGQGFILYKLNKKHPTITKWIGVGLIAVPTIAAVHNMQVAR